MSLGGVGKDNTTITLEHEFWEQLRIIAVTRNVAHQPAAGRN
jgi:predicted DNA-binding ribbon-helix-helix protein